LGWIGSREATRLENEREEVDGDVARRLWEKRHEWRKKASQTKHKISNLNY
jgi:hypothetical protein